MTERPYQKLPCKNADDDRRYGKPLRRELSRVGELARTRRRNEQSAHDVLRMRERRQRVRRAVEREMLIGLAVLEAGLIGLIACLGWYAVDRGLRPLGELKQEIDARGLIVAPGVIDTSSPILLALMSTSSSCWII